MSVLCEYTIAAYFAYCRIFCIFQQSVHIAFFPHKHVFLTAILILLCFYYLFLLGFVTSTIWLPAEWHCPCVRTPVERDGGSWFQAILYHVSAYFRHIFGVYGSAYFLNDA